MNVWKDMFASKKFQAALATVLVVVFNKSFHWNIPEDSMMVIVGIMATFIVGQGVADFGKSKALIENGKKPKE